MAAGSTRDFRQRVATLTQAYPRATVLAIAGAVLVAFIVFGLAMKVLGLPTGINQLTGWAFSPTSPTGDSWEVMERARDWIKTHADTSALYQDIFFDQQIKFQYAPTSLLVLEPFHAIGVRPSIELLNTFSRVLVGATIIAVGVSGWLFMRRFAPGADVDSQIARTWTGPLAAAATMVFYPVLYAYELGQLQVWINFLFAVAVVAWLADRRAVAGVLIGVICLLKPQFGLFLVWGLVRREWSFTLALALTGATGLLASILLYGFGSHLSYLGVLSFLSQHGESFWANQSVNGVLNRLVGHEAAIWDAHGFPPSHPLVSIGTMIATLATIAFALVLRRGAGEMSRLFDFLLAALAFTLASPIAWEHHYGVLAPCFAALTGAVVLMRPAPSRALWGAAIAISFIIAAMPMPWFRDLTGVATLVQAYLLVAGIAVLVMLHRLTRAT